MADVRKNNGRLFPVRCILLFKSSIFPIVRVSVEVHDSHYLDPIVLDPEQDAKRKCLGETTTDITLDKRI